MQQLLLTCNETVFYIYEVVWCLMQQQRYMIQSTEVTRVADCGNNSYIIHQMYIVTKIKICYLTQRQTVPCIKTCIIYNPMFHKPFKLLFFTLLDFTEGLVDIFSRDSDLTTSFVRP